MNSGTVWTGIAELTSMSRGPLLMPATGAVSWMKLKLSLSLRVGDPISGHDQKQRVAVGRRTDDGLGGELPLGARSVLDDERLAEPLRQPLTNQAREDVGRTAGRKADHDSYRSEEHTSELQSHS